MKIRIIIITSITVFLFAIFLIISTSFENIYICKDEYIVLDSNNEATGYTFHNSDGNSEKGSLEIIDGKISFILDNETIATAIYSHDSKVLMVTGVLDGKKYKNIKFKQVSSIGEYLRTVF
ncbi:MAG: hypothetical protein J6B89_03030 [Bacilli bacterium]|nr:hypothetical protein [Bacilli bacterium]